MGIISIIKQPALPHDVACTLAAMALTQTDCARHGDHILKAVVGFLKGRNHGVTAEWTIDSKCAMQLMTRFHH